LGTDEAGEVRVIFDRVKVAFVEGSQDQGRGLQGFFKREARGIFRRGQG